MFSNFPPGSGVAYVDHNANTLVFKGRSNAIDNTKVYAYDAATNTYNQSLQTFSRSFHPGCNDNLYFHRNKYFRWRREYSNSRISRCNSGLITMLQQHYMEPSFFLIFLFYLNLASSYTSKL